jgi:hypothetical protein
MCAKPASVIPVHCPMISVWMPRRRARPASVIQAHPNMYSVWMPRRCARPASVIPVHRTMSSVFTPARCAKSASVSSPRSATLAARAPGKHARHAATEPVIRVSTSSHRAAATSAQHRRHTSRSARPSRVVRKPNTPAPTPCAPAGGARIPNTSSRVGGGGGRLAALIGGALRAAGWREKPGARAPRRRLRRAKVWWGAWKFSPQRARWRAPARFLGRVGSQTGPQGLCAWRTPEHTRASAPLPARWSAVASSAAQRRQPRGACLNAHGRAPFCLRGAAHGTLAGHARTHTGERPYSCEVEGCCYSTSIRSNHCEARPHAALRASL